VLSNLPEKTFFRTVAVRGRIYAFQFIDEDASPAANQAFGGRVYAYDLAAGKWEPRGPMPVRKSSYSIVALNNKVCVIGGMIAPDTPSGSVE
jgi:hypothetical protein